jgi:peroxiredoxin
MKKHLKIIITVFFIVILAFLSYQITVKINYKKEVKKNIKTIPKFSYQNINGELFTNKNLKKQQATIFIYFNTECDFCIEESQMIKKNILKFKGIQLIFISFETSIKIKEFSNKNQLSHYDNISFLHDNKANFNIIFDIKSMPCLVLYDKNHRLIEKINGQIKVETLIKKMITD